MQARGRYFAMRNTSTKFSNARRTESHCSNLREYADLETDTQTILFFIFLMVLDQNIDNFSIVLTLFLSTECLRTISHVLAKALDEIYLGQFSFDEVADLCKRLRLVRRRHCHDTMKMWCIIPLVLCRATNRFRHCVCASEDTGVVAELVLAWDDTSCLVH